MRGVGGDSITLEGKCDGRHTNLIDVSIQAQNSSLWRLAGMYGHSEQELEAKTWRLMKHLHAQASLPWVCLGDFMKSCSLTKKWKQHETDGSNG